MTDPRTARTNGFTLVEVLVAMVVASLLMGVVMAGAASSNARRHQAAERREAVMLARHLIAVAKAEPYRPGIRGGSEDRLRWRVEESALAVDPRRFFVLTRLAMEIRGAGAEPLFAGETRKLKPLPPS